MVSWGVLGSLRCGAYMGSAANNLHGSTLHTLLSFKLFNKAKSGRQSRMSASNKAFWKSVRFLIIDEISMVSCELLDLINTRLQEGNIYLSAAVSS
jgi:hypothetical protein